LGLPENTGVPAIGPPSPTKRKKSRKTPLGNWADEIKDKGDEDLGLDRQVHKNAIAINNGNFNKKIDIKKRSKNKSKKDDQKSNKKIASIKERIDQLEKQAELTDSNLDLSELSDDGMMESVRA